MSKKFDTNPLDPEFPEKAKAAAAASEGQHTQTLPYSGAETREFPEGAPTEEQTRRFATTDFSQYSSPYNGQNIPVNYRTAGLADMNQSSSRTVDKVGLPENVLTALSYAPFSIGLIAALLQLIFLPRSEPKVRFHAAQGLAAHIAVFVVGAIIEGVDNLAPFGNIASELFWIASTVMLIIFAFKAWKGRPVHIESIDDLTNWLEEKISPRS